MMEIAVILLSLHGPDGIEVRINPSQVTSLRSPRGPHDKVFVEGANCMVNLVDGKFVAVVEPCSLVQTKLKEAGQ